MGKIINLQAVTIVICFVLIATSFSSSGGTTNDDGENVDPILGDVTYPTDLSDPDNKADYLIITSDYFYNDARLNRPGLPPNKLPIVNITYPTFGYGIGKHIEIQGIAFDPDGGQIESVHIYVENNLDCTTVLTDSIVFGDNHGDVTWQYRIELADGYYRIKVQGFDGEMYSHNATIGVWVDNSINYPPIARAKPTSQETIIGSSVVFDGCESFDPNGDELTYIWTINGEELSGAIVNYQFTELGTYEIFLKVSDGIHEATDTCVVYVNESINPINQRPFANASPFEQQVELNDFVCFDGSGSYDPDSDLLEFSWDFGDGTHGFGREVTHQYSDVGTYTVVLTVSDGILYDDDICTVIIYNNSTFNNRLNELAHWRASYNRFDVALVSVDSPFIGGNTDTNIKSFIEYVYNNWDAPHMDDNRVGYILLVGDINHITSILTWSHISQGVYDRFFVNMDDDDFPDIAIGRFPVNYYYELDVIANKTIQYEQNPAPGDWHKKITFINGKYSHIPSFPFVNETLFGYSGFDVTDIVPSEGGNTQDIFDNINDGRIIVNHIGHGSPSGWQNPPFYIHDIYQLENCNKLPIILDGGCSVGKFQNSIYNDCIGEIFLKAENKGAVAFYGASVTSLFSYDRFFAYVYKSIFENFNYILGDIINDASNMYNECSLFIHNLFGDPALDISGSIAYPNKPDLAVSHLDITTSPIDHNLGEYQLINVSVTVHNLGGDGAVDIPVRFFSLSPDGNRYLIGDQIISEIPARCEDTITQTWDVSAQIGNAIVVLIDPYNIIEEAFELNNQAGTKVSIPISGTEFLICNEPHKQANPVIYGDTVVWKDKRNNYWEIYGYNLIDHIEFPISTSVSNKGNPAIYEDTIIWRQNDDIYGYDLNTSDEFPVYTTGHEIKSPVIYEDIVVWSQGYSCKSLFAKNLSNSTVFQLYFDEAWKINPAIYGDIIVWHQPNGSVDIYGYNLSNQSKFQISTFQGAEYAPAIHGDIVVWEKRLNYNSNIYGHNLRSYKDFPISSSAGEKRNPAIYEDIVVWEDKRNGNWDIYGYDLGTSIEFPICTASGDQQKPAIYKNIVVWTDYRNGDKPDIYGLKIGPSFRSGLTASVVGPSVFLEWNPNPQWNIAGYRIYRCLSDVKDDFELIAEVDNTLTSYYDQDVDHGVTYYYKICAFTSFPVSVEGAFSNIVNITMVLPDLIVFDLSAEQINESMMTLKVTVKNVGDIDVMTPFQVTFYGGLTTPDPDQQPQFEVVIDSVEFPSLAIDDTVYKIITWEIYHKIVAIYAFVDSSGAVLESNETNNNVVIHIK